MALNVNGTAQSAPSSSYTDSPANPSETLIAEYKILIPQDIKPAVEKIEPPKLKEFELSTDTIELKETKPSPDKAADSKKAEPKKQ